MWAKDDLIIHSWKKISCVQTFLSTSGTFCGTCLQILIVFLWNCKKKKQTNRPQGRQVNWLRLSAVISLSPYCRQHKCLVIRSRIYLSNKYSTFQHLLKFCACTLYHCEVLFFLFSVILDFDSTTCRRQLFTLLQLFHGFRLNVCRIRAKVAHLINLFIYFISNWIKRKTCWICYIC